MSSLLESIMGKLDDNALGGLAAQLGTDRNKAQAGVATALPVLLGALARNSQAQGGAGALGAALDRDHDGSILDDIGGFLGRGDTSAGTGILGHVLGARQTQVQQGVAKSSGLDAAASGKLLALLAPMVMGALGKAKRQGGLDTSGLAGMLGNERAGLERSLGGQANLLGALLDSDGDGDVDLNDIAKKGGGLLGKLFGNK